MEETRLDYGRLFLFALLGSLPGLLLLGLEGASEGLDLASEVAVVIALRQRRCGKDDQQ